MKTHYFELLIKRNQRETLNETILQLHKHTRKPNKKKAFERSKGTLTSRTANPQIAQKNFNRSSSSRMHLPLHTSNLKKNMKKKLLKNRGKIFFLNGLVF